MLQERAEIQNMVVVRHWSFIDLRRLYESAEHEAAEEAKNPIESSPPMYEGIEHPGGDKRLAIAPAPLGSEQSKALVKYQATPLNQLDAKLNKAMVLPNRVLAQPDVNVVDHLLEEWTRIRELEKRRQRRKDRYGAHAETDDESDTSSYDEYGHSERAGGRYIEGPNGAQKPRKNVKNVHFRARVESDTDDSDEAKPRNRGPSRHILRSNTSSSSSPSPPPRFRRSSDSSTRFHPAPPDLTDRTRRPYTQPRDSATTNDRPTSRNGPLPHPNIPPNMQGQPRGVPPQQWQNTPQSPHWSNSQAPQSPGLRPPPSNGQFPPNGQYNPAHFPPPPGPQRKTTSGPYAMPPMPHGSYGQSPQASPSSSFQPGFRGPSGLDGRGGGPARDGNQQRDRRDGRQRHEGRYPRRHGTGDRERERDGATRARDREERDKKDKKITKGLLGAGAVAGLMDLLGGLDGI